MKENAPKMNGPAIKPPTAQLGEVTEQEETMTASMSPPMFALTAASAESNGAGTIGRKVVPFSGYGGDLEFDEDVTTTVLGRSVEGGTKEDMIANVDQPLGTNYFRYQPEFMVGKNKGGGNVLDVADRTWTWPLNNAWLQASLDRGDRIRFISDPADPTTVYREGNPKKGLTVTGQELGVLVNRGFAPVEGNGLVTEGYRPTNKSLWARWRKIAREVKSTGLLTQVDKVAYSQFLSQSQAPARGAKEYKNPSGEIVAVQTNFFGGTPSTKQQAA